MPFRTTISLPPSQPQLGYEHHFLCLGSCFANRIGQRLEQAKFTALVNPFGVVYNPISLLKLLQKSVAKQEFEQALFIQHRELWHCMDVHSQFSQAQRTHLENALKQAIQQAHQSIEQSPLCIMLTFGTAWVYRWKETEEIVANCHKLPSSHFQKELLQPQSILSAYQDFLSDFLPKYPKTQIMLTLSPVRHIKDGMPENQVSKSILRYLCHELSEQFAQVSYFPSYEIMLDDLRDYRFYGKDMLHPSELAEDYIWEQFIQAHLSPSAQSILQQWHKIQQSLQHKAFHPQSEAHQQFLQKLLQQLEQMPKIVDCRSQIEEVKRQIERS